MTDLPRITVGVLTYKRPDIIRQTFAGLRNHLNYTSPYDIDWIIADDCSGGNYERELKSIIRTVPGVGNIRVISTERNSGIGANYNNLLRHIETDIALILEDDWLLTQPLDLRPAVALLALNEAIGCVKVRSSAGLPNLYAQNLTNISEMLPAYQDRANTSGELTWLHMLPQSPNLYVWSTGINLVHRRWWQRYGDMQVGLPIGACEEEYCHRYKDVATKDANAPKLVTLPDYLPAYFKHIGYETWQGREAR
jgi:glycosyltransferase involved in cell wall biosynthesis